MKLKLSNLPVFMILRVAIGMLFLVSGFIKLMQPYQNFLASIQAYQVVTGPPAEWVAMFLPWAEVFLGVFLILGLWLKLSLLGLWVLNGVFILVVSQAIARKLSVQECGCFGESFSLTLPQILALDICLWVLFFLMSKFLNKTRFLSLDAYYESRQKSRHNSG